MKTAEEYYEECRIKGLTDDIISVSEPNYILPFYQNIFRLMDGYADQFRPKESNWRGYFEIYLAELNKVYQELLNDVEWIKKQEKFHPNVDIKVSLEKAIENFWKTEGGWQYKKRKKSKDLNWKATLTKAISLTINKVWLLPYNQQQKSTIVYNKPKFLE